MRDGSRVGSRLHLRYRSAPEAEELAEFGLAEGPSNVHPGQGTANRRFFFRNGMLELLWVEDQAEARNEVTAPTHLWERWSQRESGASPFGILLRPANGEDEELPFPGQEYRPVWLPADLRIYIAPAGVEEPMWGFMPFMRRFHHQQRFVAHPNGACEITGLTLTTPLPLRSSAARALIEGSVLAVREGADHLLTLELDHGLRKQHRRLSTSFAARAHNLSWQALSSWVEFPCVDRRFWAEASRANQQYPPANEQAKVLFRLRPSRARVFIYYARWRFGAGAE